jgi:hypothetical protein
MQLGCSTCEIHLNRGRGHTRQQVEHETVAVESYTGKKISLISEFALLKEEAFSISARHFCWEGKPAMWRDTGLKFKFG